MLVVNLGDLNGLSGCSQVGQPACRDY